VIKGQEGDGQSMGGPTLEEGQLVYNDHFPSEETRKLKGRGSMVEKRGEG